MRTAIVTGGASGMGKATALRFAREGRAVGVLDIDGEGAAKVADEINAAGGKAIPLMADLGDRGQIEAAVAQSFFASDDAGYVTGQLLGVNGGTAF